MRSLMPFTAWKQHLVGLAEGFDEGELLVRDGHELLVRDGDQRVDVLGQRADARFGAPRTLATLEQEGLGDDAHGQRAGFLRQLRNHGSRAGAGAAAHAGGDEHHVRAFQGFFQARHVLEGGLATALGIRACTEPASDAGSDGDFHRRQVRVQRLSVGVHADELHSFEAEVDHRVDGIAARAAYTNHLDACLVRLGLVGKFDRERHFRVPPEVFTRSEGLPPSVGARVTSRVSVGYF